MAKKDVKKSDQDAQNEPPAPQPDIVTHIPPEEGSIVNAAWQLGME